MCECVCTCVCVCVCVIACVCVWCMCACVCIYMCMCVYVCMCTYICVCMCAWECICVYLVSVYMHVCMCGAEIIDVSRKLSSISYYVCLHVCLFCACVLGWVCFLPTTREGNVCRSVCHSVHEGWGCGLGTRQEATSYTLPDRTWNQVQIRVLILALKPSGDVTRSIKKGYQWPHKKDLCPPKMFKK